ncbi:MAG: alpha/beta hydrolase [Melioribacteraceae bacterium]|nr:alpha/beta hydrolase [Melioribacteraceae bacterium]
MKKILISLIALIITACSPYGNLTTMEYEELKYPFEVKKIKLDDGRTLAFADEGKGDVIVFIHGLGSYSPAWQKNIEKLKEKFRCIAVDLPGYGKSSKEIHSGKMEFYADVVKELLDKLNIEKASIAGHSMGGQIGIVMALKYPDKVKSLILAAPAGFESFTAGQKQWFRDVMTVELVKLTNTQTIRANVVSNFYNMPDDAEFMITDRIAMRGAKDFENYCYTVVRSVNGMVDQPVIDFLEKVKHPTLILFGENDNLIPNPFLNPGKTEDIAKIGAEKITNSKLVMIPECGHFLQFEKPEIFNQAVIDFLSK